ncbi:signal peptidase [Lachnospiraceae bacterium PM6-15]|uniref:signal peptidase I n=1 Tax=Ohessyouella blattaphilus TaxID=2949333 RepID=UPI003E1F817B
MVKKICNFLSTFIIILLAVAALALLLPRVLGYQSMVVVSGSMEPEIHVGAIALVKEAEPQTVKVDDVITFYISSDTVVTHRVVEIDSEKQEFVTKGDANNEVDANPVKFSSLIGIVATSIPYAGYVMMKIRTPIGIAVACGLLVLLLVLIFLPGILSEDEESTNKKEKKVKNVKKD